jgi:hypothetical protein
MLQLCNTQNSIIAEVQGASSSSPCTIANPSVAGIGLRVKGHGVGFDVKEWSVIKSVHTSNAHPAIPDSLDVVLRMTQSKILV